MKPKIRVNTKIKAKSKIKIKPGLLVSLLALLDFADLNFINSSKIKINIDHDEAKFNIKFLGKKNFLILFY